MSARSRTRVITAAVGVIVSIGALTMAFVWWKALSAKGPYPSGSTFQDAVARGLSPTLIAQDVVIGESKYGTVLHLINYQIATEPLRQIRSPMIVVEVMDPSCAVYVRDAIKCRPASSGLPERYELNPFTKNEFIVTYFDQSGLVTRSMRVIPATLDLTPDPNPN